MSITAHNPPHPYTPHRVQLRSAPARFEQFQLSYDAGSSWVDSFRADSLRRNIHGTYSTTPVNPAVESGAGPFLLFKDPVRVNVNAGDRYVLVLTGGVVADSVPANAYLAVRTAAGYVGNVGTGDFHGPVDLVYGWRLFSRGGERANFMETDYFECPKDGRIEINAVILAKDGNLTNLHINVADYALIQVGSA